MGIDVPIPMAVARFNRYVTNRVTRLFTGWLPGFCILRHVGRRSGRLYRTPLNIFQCDDGFVIALTYGADVDWLKNIMAAGECSMTYLGREIPLTRPRFIGTEEGMSHMPLPVRIVLRIIGVTEFVHLKRA